MNLPIAKRTESKEAKARAFSWLWLKQKTYVFEGRDPGVWAFMGAVFVHVASVIFFPKGFPIRKRVGTNRSS
jgi:hypothetical protein